MNSSTEKREIQRSSNAGENQGSENRNSSTDMIGNREWGGRGRGINSHPRRTSNPNYNPNPNHNFNPSLNLDFNPSHNLDTNRNPPHRNRNPSRNFNDIPTPSPDSRAERTGGQGRYQYWQAKPRNVGVNFASTQDNDIKSNASESSERDNLQPDVPEQVLDIQKKLRKGEMECAICLEPLRPSEAIWSCGTCYHIFHLHCIERWVRDPKSANLSSAVEMHQDLNMRSPLPHDSPRRCPYCQSTQLLSMKDLQYYCFCGKMQDPQLKSDLTPHSCEGTCGKKTKTDCPHTCTLRCHPGRCPPCTELALPQHCPCGKTTIERRCSDRQEPVESCGQQCEKPLRCRRHYCNNICHTGPCHPCEVFVDASCFCGKKEDIILCENIEIQGEEDFSWKDGGVFACEKLCRKMLSCQNHRCSKRCHSGECDECELLLGKGKSCPCGKTQLQLNQSKNCLDPTPTCSNLCEKPLPCGTHLCRKTCHRGECAPCSVSVHQNCNCGQSSRTVPCWKTVTPYKYFCCN